jgi:hypothetical protein
MRGSFRFFVVFAVACSSKSSTPPPPATAAAATPGTATDLDKAASSRATAFCERVFGCCDDESKKLLLNVVSATAAGSQGECESAVKEFLKSARVQVVTALERKDLEFFPSKEADCLKADIAKVETEIGVCTKRVGEGEACSSGEDCNADLYCHRTNDAKQCTFVEGACKAYETRAEGEKCCNAEQCESRTCSPTNKGILCIESSLKCDQ